MPKLINQFDYPNFNHPVLKAAPTIVASSFLLVIFATLFPFNFSVEDGFAFKDIFSNFYNSTHLSDQIGNLLLFIPFGFGLTCWTYRKRWGAIAKLLTVLLLSASLSFTVEVFQIFLPSRSPTPDDIINNTIGGFLGFICFYVWKFRAINYVFALCEKSKNRLAARDLTLIFIGYIALAFLMPIPLQYATSLNNWNLRFPLLLGNERTGDRPWQGYVSEVYIADRAISKQEVAQIFSDESSFTNIGNSLVAAYRLASRASFLDQTQQLPPLVWQGQPPNVQESQGVFLTSRHWLETANPVNLLNRRLQATNQFTIGTTVATANKTQFGPARIVSVSSGPVERNFTLGQQGSDLTVRLRMPINGNNAAHLIPVIPNIFADNNFHQIVITYADSLLQVYVDKPENLHSFNYLELIPKSDQLLYYGLMFIPIGFLLALITNLSKTKFVFYVLLLIGVLLPALIVEIMLANWSSRNIQLENLLLSGLIITTTCLLLKLFFSSRLRSNVAN